MPRRHPRAVLARLLRTRAVEMPPLSGERRLTLLGSAVSPRRMPLRLPVAWRAIPSRLRPATLALLSAVRLAILPRRREDRPSLQTRAPPAMLSLPQTLPSAMDLL
jgi:hypothetical protein